MRLLIQLEDISKSYGDKMLFENVTLGINEGDKIGLVAKNGAGKSTLLNILAGRESPDSGNVVATTGLTVGFLEQTPEFDKDSTVLEACFGARNELTDAIADYEAAILAGDTSWMEKASEVMDRLSAWDFEDRIHQLLTEMRIPDINQRMGKLSGGQSKRVALASVLLENPDLLILDEPTNHLDIEIIEWLEEYLSRKRVSLLLVTHDRYFLDKVCQRIVELTPEGLYSYEGDFETYLNKRAERLEAQEAEAARMRNTYRRELEWMRRQPQARAGKAKYRIDSFHELEERLRKRMREREMRPGIRSSYIGSKIFEARNVTKSFGEKCVLKDFTYDFARYERVGIVGHNGAGKTTFLRLMQGELTPDHGEWVIGETVRFGYYRQDGIEFDSSKKVIDAITEMAEEVVVNDNQVHFTPMQFLQKFLFTPADQQKYIHTLSGGERARLQLAAVLMRNPNFLVLDEPTNDLDIMTLGVLEEYLREFEGCLVVVSHDRHFLDSLVDHLFVLEDGGHIKDFPGNYSEYRQYLAAGQKAERQKVEKPTAENNPKRDRERPVKMTYAERKEFEALGNELENLEAERRAMDEKFASGDVMNDAADVYARYEELKRQIDEKEMRWLELSEKAQ